MALETKEDESYKNNLAHQVFQKLIMSRTPDVYFIFESEDDEEATKIPAHKDVLAVISPVFDTMFNGELKEKGDVKIVDASAAAFKEFLQFFYNDQVKLTMEHISDVLNLAHKYDVTGCFQKGVAFLKEHLNSENLIWGLQLALKYESDDLKAFCKRGIENEPKALDVFKAEDGDPPANKQLSSSTDLTRTLMETLSIANEMISKQSVELNRFRSKCVFELTLSTYNVYTESMIPSEHTITLSPKDFHNELWLREIHFTKIFTKRGSAYQAGQLKGTVSMNEEGRFNHHKYIFSNRFGTNPNEEFIKLSEPIRLNSSYTYKITIKPTVEGYCSAGVKSSDAFEKKLTCSGNYFYTLIDRLYFEELRKN